MSLDLQSTLWQAADKLRNNLDAAEYKHVVLGLVFLKYVSDVFEDRRARLEATRDAGTDPESPGAYRAKGSFWVPPTARWASLEARAGAPGIGKRVDAAMAAIERDNPVLAGVLPRGYGRPGLDQRRLGELVALIGGIGLGEASGGSRDLLGHVYEYFLGQFASAEGKRGGQFYTPQCVVRLLAELLAPYEGRVFDPCCGSGGMFVSSETLVQAHGGRLEDIGVFGQESNPTTWRLARMNLAIRGIDGDLGPRWGDSLHHDHHADLRADYVLANPPFNDRDWGGDRLREDPRWRYGVPPVGNANFAWVQHIIHHLAPAGIAGIVLANGSMSSQQSGEGRIRRAIVEADLVDCMVALPGQLFHSTQIPVCLWVLARDKHGGRGVRGRAMRDRSTQTLFIDARKLGTMLDRVHRELTGDDLERIADAYHRWRGDAGAEYRDVPGFCRSVATAEIAAQRFVLTPGRYVGVEAAPATEGEAFEDEMARLRATLEEQLRAGKRLERSILEALSELGHGR
ncbi:class I SAM-dependent DNA methyltransferase [Paraliomyxa miuraensis]|uniref:class I SAM-dependent DNA methyltransferase n=1 Tax=Paraliomyxa miuraensis TaxID=376150 RepID=UPI0022529EC4|nr:class I SAM-dependent DNA methyltransferase [Paraliomyxa miuraensis]MCX4241349.1 type I restriction-modification system subunit M [Paraliomyxa miuraensis]